MSAEMAFRRILRPLEALKPPIRGVDNGKAETWLF